MFIGRVDSYDIATAARNYREPEEVHMAEKPNTHVAVLYTHKTDGPQIDRVHRALAASYAASLEEETFVKNGSTRIVEIKMADRERLASLA